MRRTAGVLAVLLVVAGSGAAAAQGPTTFDARSAPFRLEEDTGGPRAVVTGWIYNDGADVVGLLRLRLEVLDASGNVVARQNGWGYGNAAPGGRVYFRIPSPAGEGSRRIVLESYVRQSVVQSP